MDTNNLPFGGKLPFGASDLIPLKYPSGQPQGTQGSQVPKIEDLIPHLPVDLTKITTPSGLFNTATATYCATAHPELYTYAALGGAAATAVGLLALVGVFAFLGKLRRMMRGAQ